MEITIRLTNHNKHDQQQNGVENHPDQENIYIHTLWLFIVAIWKTAYLYMIYDDLPIKKCDFP